LTCPKFLLLVEHIEVRNMAANEIIHILIHTIRFYTVWLLKKPKKILETIKRRELDIEIMELQLKHGLTKKRAESKLLIMYYKACNAMSRAKLMMRGISGHDIKEPYLPSSPNPVNSNAIQRMDPWDDHKQKRT